MQEVVKAAVERRERGRFSRSRLRDERRSRSTDVTPASALGSIPDVAYTTPPATAGRPEEQMEMSAVEQEQVEGGGDAGATGESNRPTAVIMEQDKPKWTALQAWSVYGFATCTVPWYLAYNLEKKDYVIKSFWIQQIFCILQHVSSVFIGIMTLQRVPKLITAHPTPFTYIQVGGTFLAAITRLWFAKIVFFNRSSIMEYHNTDMFHDSSEAGNGEGQASTRTRPWGTSLPANTSNKTNTKTIGLSFLCFGLFTVLMIGADFGIRLDEYDDQWKEGGFPAVIQTAACFARMTYFWRDEDNCGLEYIAEKTSDLPKSEIAWGIGGAMTFVNGKMAQYQRFIAINVCIWMFYLDATYAMRIIENTDRRAIHSYNFIKERAEWLSSFAGPLLLLELMEIATNIPEWSVDVFTNNIFIPMYIVTLLAGFFSFLVLGSYGSLIAEKIVDQLAEQRGQSSRPSTPRQMASYLFRIARNSIGIGISGIFVLNFATLFAYMSIVGTFVMVLYEVTH